MIFKKDITPFAKGGKVIKHKGKGSAERRPDPMTQMTSRYPKPMPSAEPAPAPMGMPGQMSLPFKEPE